MGHAQGKDWYVPLSIIPKVEKAIREKIIFDYDCYSGLSGGGLFDDQWDLVGMILRKDGPSCVAISFDRIRATLEIEWEEYEVNLRHR